MTETRYPALRRYVSETPWALLPSTLLMLREVIGRRLDGDRLSAEELAEITAAAPKRATTKPSQGSVAVLPLWGILSPHQVSDLSSGPTTALDTWGSLFDDLVNDPSVGTIILDVDSPGGSVDLVPETAAKVRAANARKQIVAVANTRAASAAYWIASQAGELVVSPSGAVGSIGVYAAHEDVSRQLEAEGVTMTLISAGDHKTDGNPFEPLSDEARATIQANVDAYYGMFKGDVAKGRGVEPDVVEKKFGQGKMLLAGDALKAGMVDGVGTLEQVIDNVLGGKPASKRARASEFEPALAAAAIGGDSVGIKTGLPRLVLAAAAAAELVELVELEAVPALEATIHGPGPADAADGGSSAPESGVVPVHHTKVVDKPWDGPSQVAELNRPVTKARGFGMFAWFDKSGNDPDGDGYPDAKSDWKFPHHDVVDGEPTAAVVSACRNGLARLEGADIPDADKAGVKAHLQAHIDDFNKNSGGSAAGSAAPGGDHNRTKEQTMDEQSMQELVARREEIDARILELDKTAAGRSFNEAEKAEFDELKAELKAIGEKVAGIEAETAERRELLAAAAERSTARVPAVEIRKPTARGGIASNVDRKGPQDPYAIDEYPKHADSVSELKALQRDGARRINDGLTHETDRAADHVERILLRGDKEAAFARRVILAGSPEYEDAFAKLVTRGRDALTTAEDSVIKAAISDTGLGSETPIPITIDPTVQLSTDGATNPIRQLARTVTIVGNKWRGITSGGVTVKYDAEVAEVDDQTPTFTAPDVEVVKAHGYVEFSIEVDEDWGALRSELAREFADAKDIAEASKFLSGSGTNEPEGLITALTASTAPAVVLKTAATATFAIDDPDLISDDLPPRFDARASWLASKTVWAKTEALYRAAGNADPFSFAEAGLPQPLISGQIGRIFRGYPMFAASDMDAGYGTSGKNIMVLGDFGRGMVIVDRIGMNVELIPLVMGADQRPKGARALYVYFRNNTSVQVVNAFRVLQVK